MSLTALKQASSYSRESLHAYQLKAVEFIKQKRSCALWVDMGLGKSITTLTAIADLFARFEIGKVLIIAPLRVAKHTWPQEIERWEHVNHLSYAVIHGAKEQRINSIGGKEDIHIINREMVVWLIAFFDKEWPYDMVVIDEASSFKSPQAKRFKALKKALPKINRLVELTGTPASNGLMDIWSQLYLIDGGERLGRAFSGFRDRYFTSDYMGYKWELRQGSEHEIYKKLQNVCLTLSAKDYLQLPRRVDNVITMALGNNERSQYRALEKEFLLEIEQNTIEVLNAAVLSNKLRQFTNGALYTDDRGTWCTVHQHKLNALEEIIAEAAGQPVFVAYNFKFDQERIKQHFKPAVSIDEIGAIEKWNKGQIPLLIAHPASAGHGLNLQHGGNIIVWFGLTWSLELYQQFNARLHRQGQMKPVIVHHLVIKDSVDMTVLDALQHKRTTQAALLNALKEDIKARIAL